MQPPSLEEYIKKREEEQAADAKVGALLWPQAATYAASAAGLQLPLCIMLYIKWLLRLVLDSSGTPHSATRGLMAAVHVQPKFLSKKQREELALKQRQEVVSAQRTRSALSFADRLGLIASTQYVFTFASLCAIHGHRMGIAAVIVAGCASADPLSRHLRDREGEMRKAHETFMTSIEKEKDSRQREAERRAEAERLRRNEVTLVLRVVFGCAPSYIECIAGICSTQIVFGK